MFFLAFQISHGSILEDSTCFINKEIDSLKKIISRNLENSAFFPCRHVNISNLIMLLPFTKYSEIKIFKQVVSCTASSPIEWLSTLSSLFLLDLNHCYFCLLLSTMLTRKNSRVYIDLLPIDIYFLTSFIAF